ncbi:PLP-dependent aminotransferase family protein [Pseudothioclava nitratireducens]|uniref:aminotransferase-like domain-containing protein n=1 Tax=Pseudothioclava nitratireducens TaxID=1928646 RepID=UPI0023DCBDC9|nr:PLP-dependent aminotransferase family protein [Defluviimonas nitratireducens]MDF1620730.1 PLP-dependent aminotransferase family protein [Defluviimonas nitratireducens]
MTDTTWRPDLGTQSGPKYLALVRALREGVRRGSLEPGSKLPTVRDLAWRLGVTPGTVARAYQIATQEGLLEAAVGRGTFVSTQSRRLGPTEPLYTQLSTEDNSGRGPVDLRSPQLPDVGQTEAIARAMAEAAREIGQKYLEYPGLKRDLFAREASLSWFECCDLGPITADDLVLTHGGQNGINLTLQICLRGDRPVVLTEELAYPGFRHAAKLVRAETVAVALDEEGMIPAALDAACRRNRAQVVCITTEAQNPTAARMGLERRKAIVAVARAHDLQILEDDCYTAPSSGLPSLRALAPERTWHVTSLSKTISAGMRFGIVVCPEGMGEAGRLAAQHSYFGLARPVTDIMTRILRSGDAMRLRQAAQEAMGRRLERAVQALSRFDIVWQPGLSFFWLRLPLGWRSSAFARAAEAEGVLVRSADEYVLHDGHAPNAVRIAIAGAVPEADFHAAIDRLVGLLENPSGDLAV